MRNATTRDATKPASGTNLKLGGTRQSNLVTTNTGIERLLQLPKGAAIVERAVQNWLNTPSSNDHRGEDVSDAQKGVAAVESDETLVVDPEPITQTAIPTYRWEDTFYIGAQFLKRTAAKGRDRVKLTVLAVDGIVVRFDKDFRCKAWSNCSAKRVMNSQTARIFLQEFERQ